MIGEPRRLTVAEIPIIREVLMWEQDCKCLACGRPFYAKMPLDPVLDHNHKTGAIRGVLHRGCNSMLGKIENYAPRAWLKAPLLAFAIESLGKYKSLADPLPGMLHPLHRTADEKKARTKKRAARRRKAAK
jgi:hypothetical protein